MLRDLFTWIFTDPSNGQVAAYRIIVLFILCVTLSVLYYLRRDVQKVKEHVDKVDDKVNGHLDKG